MGEDVAVIVVSLARSGLFGDLGLIGARWAADR